MTGTRAMGGTTSKSIALTFSELHVVNLLHQLRALAVNVGPDLGLLPLPLSLEDRVRIVADENVAGRHFVALAAVASVARQAHLFEDGSHEDVLYTVQAARRYYNQTLTVNLPPSSSLIFRRWRIVLLPLVFLASHASIHGVASIVLNDRNMHHAYTFAFVT